MHTRPRTPGRLYLKVPIEQKDHAKELGALWDMASSLWYVPNGLDHSLFKKWFWNEPSFEQKRDAAMQKYLEKKSASTS